ncbi:hypothetical protein DQ237_10960 [Blastococcus sp. TF02-8]|uniref:hypothetical protein n=1 Tax=Blastococcus sp. TF02-8 TaxID=2250574 RepID=UPI000E02C939|nr:hypothetical protein [Blastococcus sp. TF02-8]RBY96354.1 hypothetical protein DQ237_10960 [Blastococcus sp. TF02-8]
MDGTAVDVERTAERQELRRVVGLSAIFCAWLVAMPAAVGSALASDWPLPPELPTAAQVAAARSAAYGA